LRQAVAQRCSGAIQLRFERIAAAATTASGITYYAAFDACEILVQNIELVVVVRLRCESAKTKKKKSSKLNNFIEGGKAERRVRCLL
jgi:hypothetical protein